MKAQPKPPKHLSKASEDFWKSVQTDYAINDQAGLRLLTLACEALDEAETARLTIAREGQVYTDRFDAPRVHPAVSIQRNSMATFARLVKALGLDLQPGS